MQTVSRLAVAYAINALWQLPLLVLAAEVTVRLSGRARGKTLFRVWVACLFLALMVPALPLLHVPVHVLDYGSTHGPVAAPARAGVLHLSFSGGQFDRPVQIDQRTAGIPSLILNCALYIYLASVLFALIRLAWGLGKTRSLLHSAQTSLLRGEVRDSWESCLKLFGKARIRLMSTSRLAGPATVSWPGPIVLLPAKLRDEDANEMTAVFCHELAHVQRNDFLYNIFIELFGVLLFYHPAFHWMRRRIQETRELACDDMAADAMAGRHVYAQSLLRLTEKMLAAAVVPQPGCALGIFEGEILERRIMNLLDNRSKHTRLRIFTSLATGLCLLLGTCVLSTNLGLKLVNAQSAIQANSAPSGWFMAGDRPASYQTGVDKAVIENGQPSAYLRSVVPDTGGFGTLMQSISAADYAGKRVRIRAWVKSQDVAEWAGVWMRVDKDRTAVAFDNMQNRAIRGTQPWKTYDVVLDVPEDATGISFGVLLSGAGEVWISDVGFEVVGKEIPTTSPAPNQTPALPSHPVNLKFTD
jgi:beta-lactamase regulating signal transducer with metallopeptidase domain